MKKITFLLFFVTSFIFAQNPGFSLLKKINGVDIYYKSSKTKEDTKKDTWLIEYEYINTTGKDIYYKANIIKDGGLFGTGEYLIIGYFALVSIKNAKAMSLTTSDHVVYLEIKQDYKLTKENLFI